MGLGICGLAKLTTGNSTQQIFTVGGPPSLAIFIKGGTQSPGTIFNFSSTMIKIWVRKWKEKESECHDLLVQCSCVPRPEEKEQDVKIEETSGGTNNLSGVRLSPTSLPTGYREVTLSIRNLAGLTLDIIAASLLQVPKARIATIEHSHIPPLTAYYYREACLPVVPDLPVLPVVSDLLDPDADIPAPVVSVLEADSPPSEAKVSARGSCYGAACSSASTCDSTRA